MRYPAWQRWFLDAVVGVPSPDHGARGDRAAPDQGGAQRDADGAALPSWSLTGAQRLQIYRDMYDVRLRDALAADYPALCHLMGAGPFATMARDYMTRYPSRSYTLNHIGYAVPHFLSTYADVAQRALLVDVARLERALSVAFDTGSHGQISTADLSAVPPDLWPEIRFRLDASVHLLAFDHDVSRIVDAITAAEPVPDVPPTPSWVAVWRKDYTVWRKPLSAVAYTILTALAAGASMGAAMETAAGQWQDSEPDSDQEVFTQQIFAWFSEWVGEGFFAALVTPHTAASCG